MLDRQLPNTNADGIVDRVRKGRGNRRSARLAGAADGRTAVDDVSLDLR